ncbi:hypothetical protein PYCCODRAFT_1430115 [Trametes coccinea BRFM310]|uniref:Uncharacterized protein n=1 Tax=Trametes coccinea (strain BRFM310) TaxID=1353009 RepID=A0A1Y2J3D7_TRAC3|nr:hypothetical protein PYCCODRAFT_1430115 [Trametes coccinea BRFM310]
MKHLRRRTASTSTPSTSNHPSISVSSPAPLGPPLHADAESPLYARFTSTRRGQDGVALKPLVSGPIALAPRKLVQVPVSVAVPAAPSQARAEEDPTAKRAQADAQEVRRMPSEGAALPGQHESGVSLGRHGTRIDGDRVLLPARKVTRKRAESDAAVGSAGPTRVEDAHRLRAKDGSEGSSGGTQRAKEEGRHVDGERVPLPARKVTRRKVEDVALRVSPSTSASTLDNVRPSLETSRNDSQGTYSTTSSSRPFKETRAKIPGRALNETQKPVAGASSSARTSPPSVPSHPLNQPQASSSSAVAFPSTPTSSSVRSPVGAASEESPSTHTPDVSSSGPGGVGVGGVVVIVDPEDAGEDKFSKPKRSRLNTIATTTPASASAPLFAPPLAVSASTGSAPSHRPSTSTSAKPSARDAQPLPPVIDRKRSIDVGESSSSAQSTTPKPQPTSTAGAVTSSASTSSPASSTSARPPRRRKYSLLAAFGHLRGGHTSESERERDVQR